MVPALVVALSLPGAAVAFWLLRRLPARTARAIGASGMWDDETAGLV